MAKIITKSNIECNLILNSDGKWLVTFLSPSGKVCGQIVSDTFLLSMFNVHKNELDCDFTGVARG